MFSAIFLYCSQPTTTFHFLQSMIPNKFPAQNLVSLAFKDNQLEHKFKASYDKTVRLPLRLGIIISILSWYSGIVVIYSVIPDQLWSLGGLTVIYIGSYFGFIIYATYKPQFQGYYHLMGAISNLWAGMYTIYFCACFPAGDQFILPVLIFIIFFGSYMIRLRWISGSLAALSYISVYQVYILVYSNFTSEEVLFYSFVSWMVFVFALFAGRTAEQNYRVTYIQRQTIKAQNEIIEQEKELLLREVHHRVHNNLQIILSLFNLQLKKLDNPLIAEKLAETQGRILSMSLVHQGIQQSSNFSQISLNTYVTNLWAKVQLKDVEVPFTFEKDIPDEIQFDIETAIPLGLILNEILSRFYNYATTSTLQCSCKLAAEKATANQSKISFSFKGLSLPTDYNQSFSYELIEALVEQLEGTVNLNAEQEGGVFEIWV